MITRVHRCHILLNCWRLCVTSSTHRSGQGTSSCGRWPWKTPRSSYEVLLPLCSAPVFPRTPHDHVMGGLSTLSPCVVECLGSQSSYDSLTFGFIHLGIIWTGQKALRHFWDTSLSAWLADSCLPVPQDNSRVSQDPHSILTQVIFPI